MKGQVLVMAPRARWVLAGLKDPSAPQFQPPAPPAPQRPPLPVHVSSINSPARGFSHPPPPALPAADEPDLTATLHTLREGTMVLMGPLTFIQGGYGVRARLPVYIRDVDENATWGSPWNLSANCGSLCYNAVNRTKFWGFVS
jgi:hypothetical protein